MSNAPASHPDSSVHTGIPEETRGQLADGLSAVLADSYILYLKTQSFHWNVTGPHFLTLHTMFEQQYIDLRDAIDLIAERIRALGRFAPGSFRRYSELSSIPEAEGDGNSGDVPDAMEMVRQLMQGHETLARAVRRLIPAASDSHDDATADLLTQRLAVHEKTAWMLRATLGR